MVPVNPKAQARVPKPQGLDLARPFSETTLTAFLDAADPATKPCSFGEADETFDKGFDDESSEGEKKKKKKNDRKKKKKNSSRLNPDHEDPFYIGGGHVRPGDVSVDDVPVVRLSKKELKADKKSKKKKKSRKVGR